MDEPPLPSILRRLGERKLELVHKLVRFITCCNGKIHFLGAFVPFLYATKVLGLCTRTQKVTPTRRLSQEREAETPKLLLLVLRLRTPYLSSGRLLARAGGEKEEAFFFAFGCCLGFFLALMLPAESSYRFGFFCFLGGAVCARAACVLAASIRAWRA